MKTAKFGLIIYCLLGFVFGLSSALGAEALTSWVVTWPFVGFAQGGAGFAVSPNVDVVATALGFGGAMDEPVQVILWDTFGQQLGSVIVNSNSSVLNLTHYEAILPVPLHAGETNYVSACGTISGVWVGEALLAGYNSGQFSVAPELNYIGMAVATNSLGLFPETVVPGANLPIGANLQFYRAPLVVVAALHTRNTQVQLDFNVWGRAPGSFTLLESAQPAGPWQTNVQAQLITNAPGTSYSFSTTALRNAQFYR
ncbi:MAG: hypothetical protein ACREIC_07655, partial [Limisphaerales bacterium]